MRHTRTFDSRFVTALLIAASLAVPALGHAGVRLAVSPETLTVAPGATFTVELRVPVAGSAFNGYDAIVDYDPSQLTFLPTSPTSLQEGSSMRGACNNTIVYFSATSGSLNISHVLLCNGIALTGPSQLYVLKFRASNTAGASWIRLRGVQFYNDGLFVNPAVTSDALIHWGAVLDANPEPRVSEVRLAVRGNPSRGEQWIDASSPVPGEQQLVVFDAAGRAIRTLDSGPRPAGTRAVLWDGRDGTGRRVAPGVYEARLLAAGRSVTTSLVRLP